MEPGSHANTEAGSEGRVTKVGLRGIGAHFGRTVVLRGIDAEFVAGEVASVEGANGSGKSTMIGIIGAMIRPSSGEVRYEPDLSIDQIRGQLGWVSHETLTYPDLTARQSVALACSLYGVADQWERVSSRFALATFADRPLRVLSRGQRQRVALARALGHAPSLVLLDEPSAGLDTDGIQRLTSVMREEAEGGAIVVLVTHDPELAIAVKARRLQLDRGKLKPLT